MYIYTVRCGTLNLYSKTDARQEQESSDVSVKLVICCCLVYMS